MFQPYVTVHYLAVAVMSTPSSLGVGNGTFAKKKKAKNKCLNFQGPRMLKGRKEKCSRAETERGTLCFFGHTTGLVVEAAAAVKTNLMIHKTNTSQTTHMNSEFYINNV